MAEQSIQTLALAAAYRTGGPDDEPDPVDDDQPASIPWNPVSAVARARELHNLGRALVEEVGIPPLVGSAQLTLREREVLAMIAKGHRTSLIADLLFVGEETVKSHVRNMLAKTKASNRAHLVAMALASTPKAALKAVTAAA